MKKLLFIFVILFSFSTCRQTEKTNYLRISYEEYEQKVYASWLGQMIGNIYGLVHENKYIDEPGPEDFPYGYDYKKTGLHPDGGTMTEAMEYFGGGFSDDDTDFEYMYMLEMEKHGIEPTYELLHTAWKYHVRDYVWVANRAALRLMHYGHRPPATGRIDMNEHWFQIDPQLINEIWAVTAPGMEKYAAEKSDWAARITNDSWGVEPTVAYGAMYARAFFESDIMKLIQAGKEALPEGAKFTKTIDEVIDIYSRNKDDWKAGRKELAQKYYHDEPEPTKTIWNADLNGACSILGLLYGQGDFQKTLDILCAIGFDCDNQAATMCGLLAIANGIESIPRDLLYPIESWKKPFNDSYKNRTRHDLPDGKLTDMASRTAALGKKVILANGGETIMKNGKEFLQIDPSASFIPPMELPRAPELIFGQGQQINWQINHSAGKRDITFELADSDLPETTTIQNGRITGVVNEAGTYNFKIKLISGEETIEQSYVMIITGENLAGKANEILSPQSQGKSNELLRNGETKNETFRSKPESSAHVVRYGYEWNEKQNIRMLVFCTGQSDGTAGWFTSLDVEFLNDDGSWEKASILSISPELNLTNQRFSKTGRVPHAISIDPVKTKGIRISGETGGGTKHRKTRETEYFSSLAELEVF